MTHEIAATGIVYLVGAGPGDPALLTLRGAELLGHADVIIHDGLIHAALLELASPHAVRIYAGKKHAPEGQALAQAEINDLLVAHARAGKRVVRLKGGDSFVFGRGSEECEHLADHGVRFEIVPGVTAATAVPAYAGIPLTARSLTSTVAFATGHEADGKPVSEVDWEALARAGTVVLFMALRTLADCCQRLIAAGRDPGTPAAAIYWGTTARQRTVVATLADLPRAAAEAGLRPPVLVIVGEVVSLRPRLSWYESRPLFGASVLVPRGLDQSRGFARALTELGAEPVIMPVTRTVPPEPDTRPLIDRALAALSGYDWVLLTSATAVMRLFEELAARRLDARAFGAAAVACVGEATARALGERGIVADVVPAQGNGQAVAKAMLEAHAAHSRPGRAGPMRVLFPRAAQGREEAVDELLRAGATMDLVPIYATVATPADHPSIQHGLARLRARDIDVAAFFAPSQVTALFEILGDRAAELLGACRIVAAIGNTTRTALTRRGVDVHVVASSPEAERMAHEIAAHYQATWRATQQAHVARAHAKAPGASTTR